MSFFHTLSQQTVTQRQHLLGAPIIQRALNGDICLQEYVDFLVQAYHHVKHTVPLLMATGARLSEDKEWLREAVAEYIEEELGHQEWILNDIAACGYSKEAARRSQPNASTELMVAYAWDTIQRGNALGFFGMVHVLEGTSIQIASMAADRIQAALQLPNQSFSYLHSHGKLDLKHVEFFESLMNRIDDKAEQATIIHSARMFYQLYGNIFRELEDPAAQALAKIA